MVSASRYEPVTLIGRGASSEVWLGVLRGAEGFRKPVVLKRAFVGVNEDLEEAQRSLVAEAHLAAALNHPNIIHVYELVDLPEGVMLAMEHLPGLSVRAVSDGLATSGGYLPWAVAARIVGDAARGLEYAHRARDARGRVLNIVHRDISPDNIVVTEEGLTKVVDFGIARSTLIDKSTGFVVKGNIGYLSPEQARGEPLDCKSDVFSLGVVLHELLTGETLFEQEQPGKTLEAVLSAPVPPLGESISAVVRDVVGRMLVRDRRNRKIDMGEVADSLESASSSQGGTQRDVAVFLRAEFDDRLRQRHARLAELLERPTVLSQKLGRPTHTLTGTVSFLELALETPLTTMSIKAPLLRKSAAESDTVVEERLQQTLIERPLLDISPKKKK